MGGITVVMGVMIGMSGWRKYRMLRGRSEPLSFQESLAIGVLIGVVVFLLHTFNKWPYFDPWRRKVEGGEEAVTVNGDRSNRGSGETTRQRVGRYVFGAGVLLIVSALYVAEYWRLALWLASIGVIVAFVGAIIQTA